MTIRHQRGHLRCKKRKNGPSAWEFLWRENDASGKRLRRTAVIGTVEQYPTEDLALAAVNGLRVSINEVCNRQRSRSILVGDLVDHYKQTELCDRSEWYWEATKVIYAEFLKTWIRPHWAMTNIRDVRTIVVENWLRQLRRKDGNPLADTTKTKIRSLMSVLFNHAIRYEWLEQGKNPITLVRQSTARQKNPEVLDPHEIQNLLLHLESPYRLMVLLAATTGLRRSELFALKWSDIDFTDRTINVTRSIYGQVIGNCKTEASQKAVPFAHDVKVELSLWKEQSCYQQPDDWVFASPHRKGTLPYWPAILMRRMIRPAASRAGITKWIGWHTFRHSYATLLIANGENVKVVQELMRHGSARITVDIYSQARSPAKRAAQQRLVQMILPQEGPELAIPLLETPQHLDRVSDLSPAELQAIWRALDQEKFSM
jgi:integrase